MKILERLRSAVHWLMLGRRPDHSPLTTHPPLTPRTRPPACPVCGGSGFVECQGLLFGGEKLVLACVACSATGVLPASLARLPGCPGCHRAAYHAAAPFN